MDKAYILTDEGRNFAIYCGLRILNEVSEKIFNEDYEKQLSNFDFETMATEEERKDMAAYFWFCFFEEFLKGKRGDFLREVLKNDLKSCEEDM